jgi:hypothetical protein
MKCSHPLCNRGIGLVSHRRVFRNGLYCSRRCRDDYLTVHPMSRGDARLFTWLFALTGADAGPRLVPARVRVRAR